MLFLAYQFQWLIVAKGETIYFLDPIQNLSLYRYYSFRWTQEALEILVINELPQTDGGCIRLYTASGVQQPSCSKAWRWGHQTENVVQLMWAQETHLLSRYKNLLKGGGKVGSWSLGNVWGVLVELGRDTQGWQGPQNPDVASGMSRRIATSNQHPWSQIFSRMSMLLKGSVKFSLLLSLLGIFLYVF